MNTGKIKFLAHVNPNFINELREKVKDYFITNNISKFGNANKVWKSIFMISLYLIPYILMVSGLVTALPLIFL